LCVQHVMLFGAGPMAQAYAKVLDAQNVCYDVFGRGEASARSLTGAIGRVVLTVPFEEAKGTIHPATKAIVAVSNDQLYPMAMRLLNAGIKEILLEKPGGISIAEVSALSEAARRSKTRVLIGFNRRFYASTLKARDLIDADGGVVSCHFQFTEWLNTIPRHYAETVYRTWVLSNPIHVLDHFIFLCGRPISLESFRKGGIDWHPTATVFTGAGSTEHGVLFSYHADWESAGRWNVEVYTRHRKLIFCPMEKLSEVLKNSVAVRPVEIDDVLDQDFKPGLYRQVEAFLNGRHEDFCSIEKQFEHFGWYYRITGYSKDDPSR
jgi:predicted dehydrogenase